MVATKYALVERKPVGGCPDIYYRIQIPSSNWDWSMDFNEISESICIQITLRQVRNYVSVIC